MQPSDLQTPLLALRGLLCNSRLSRLSALSALSRDNREPSAGFRTPQSTNTNLTVVRNSKHLRLQQPRGNDPGVWNLAFRSQHPIFPAARQRGECGGWATADPLGLNRRNPDRSQKRVVLVRSEVCGLPWLLLFLVNTPTQRRLLVGVLRG